MKSLGWTTAHTTAFCLLTTLLLGEAWASPPVPGESTQTTTDVPSTADDSATALMRFLEARVRRDPENAGANARLAEAYLQRLRETGSIDYLDLALRAARAALASVPSSRNTTGLVSLSRAEFASHDFAAARDRALELIKLDPGKGYYYVLLSDALLELGDYEASEAALQTMARLEDRLTIEGETRLARHALLRGDVSGGQRHLLNALALEHNLPDPPREGIAWSEWQSGEYAFSSGDYENAERHYGDSLATFPDYFNALASMGRVRAARGDLKSAIEYYERAVQRLPDPTFVGALGDPRRQGQGRRGPIQARRTDRLSQRR